MRLPRSLFVVNKKIQKFEVNRCLLVQHLFVENDISLITGQIRTVEIPSDVVDDSSDGQLSVIGKRDVARIESQPLRNGKEFFGLTQESAATFSVISDGTTGIAAQYNYEK